MLNYISPFIEESPFKKSAKDIADIQFQGSHTKSLNGVSVFSDKQITEKPLLRKMFAYKDKNANDVYDKDVDKYAFKFHVKVFISQDDSYLRDLLEKTNPDEHEVCLFLEDNSGDLFSGSSSYVKIGKNFRSHLLKRQKIGEGQIGLFENENFKQHFGNVELDFTDSQLQELIETGEIRNIKQEMFIALIQSASLTNMLLGPAYGLMADGIFALTDFLKKHIKFQNYHWDPGAKKPDPNDSSVTPKMIENKEFEPILFPFSNKLIEGSSALAEEELSGLVKNLITAIQKRERAFITKIDSYQKILTRAKDLPSKMTAVVNGISSALTILKAKVKELVGQLLKGIEGVFSSMAYLGKKIISTINAYYCGLWNGLMDSIIGIIDIIGFLFKAFRFQADFIRNAQTKIPRSLELLDEAIQALVKIDFGKVTDKIVGFFKKIDLGAFLSKTTIEKVAYFFGAIVGFIVEIVVGILITGGVESVYAVVNKLIANGAKVLKTLQAAIVKFFGKSLKQLKDDILLIISKIVAFLKKGTEGILQALRVLFDSIVNSVKLSKKAIEKIKRKLQITTSELDILENAGLHFTKFEDGVATACKLL